MELTNTSDNIISSSNNIILPSINSSPYIRIQRTKGWIPINFAELWEYRELLYFLIWKDIKVRYKQTMLGIAWVILQPFLFMIIFSIVFEKLIKIPSDKIPYPLFCYSALAVWMFFSNSLNQSCQSLLANSELLKKIYFPRLLIPLANILSGVIDLLLAYLVLIGMMFWYNIPFNLSILWLPFLLVLVFFTTLGFGLWLSALNVQFRDVRHILPFFIQLLLFVSPIIYPSSLVPPTWKFLYTINPMVGVIEGFRWALFQTSIDSISSLWISLLSSLFLVISGLFYFRRMEKTFADII